jgi:phosphate transport system permease protein
VATDVDAITRVGAPLAPRALGFWGPPSFRGWTSPDALFRRMCAGFGLSIIGLLAFLVLELIQGAWPSVEHFGFGFAVRNVWDPVAERFGAATFVYGTVVSSSIALLIAVPLGLGVAIFLVELAPRRVAAPVGFLVELLAAIPSVVYGLWGLFVLAPLVRDAVAPALRRGLGFLPFFQGTSHGVGMLTAGLVLSIMIVPFIAAVSRDVIAIVPQAQREGALAVGATHWETIWHVVLPAGRPGIVGAVILALGRALGETMAVTMVIGNTPRISLSLFDPAYTMSSVIANEYAEASTPLHLAALTELGLLLFVVTFLANGIASLLIWRMARVTGGGA